MKSNRIVTVLFTLVPVLTQALRNEAIEGEIMKLNHGIAKVLDLVKHTSGPPVKTGGSYTDKYGALCKMSDGNFVFGAFATLDGYDDTGTKAEDNGKPVAQQFLCLGFGQITRDMAESRSAMQAYLAHPDAFGIIVSLPAFFSGKEQEAIKYFSHQEIQKEIKQEMSRLDGIPPGDLFVECAWSIPFGDPTLSEILYMKKKYVAIFRTTESGANSFRFCVDMTEFSYEHSDDEVNTFIIGTPHSSITKATLTFVDYVQQANMTDMMFPPKAPIDLTDHLYALTYCFDFVFRKLAEQNRKDKDKTPAANQALDSAVFLLRMNEEVEFNKLIALLLKDLHLQSATTIDEIKNHFGNEIGDLMEPKSTIGVNRVYHNLTPNQIVYFQTFEDTSTKRGLEENDNLHSLLKNRYRVFPSGNTNCAGSTVQFVSGFIIKKNVFAIFSAKFDADETMYHFLMQGQALGDYVWGVVVGELLTSSVKDIQNTVVHNYAPAISFYGQKADKVVDPVTAEDREIVKATAFAARKHSKDLRKGVFKSAYMNHVLGALRAEVVEGFKSLKGLNTLSTYVIADHKKINIVKVLIVVLLHDTLEKTSATANELEIMFGKEVASWVSEVTDPSDLKTTIERKEHQEKAALTQSAIAVLTKLADRLNNLRDWFRLLPEALAWKKITFYFESSEKLVANFKKNYEDNSNNWQDWEKAVYNNLMGQINKMLDFHAASRTPSHYFYLPSSF